MIFFANSRKTQTEVFQVSPEPLAPLSSRCFDEKLWDVTRASEAWRQQKGKQQKLINPVTWFKTTESLLIPNHRDSHRNGPEPPWRFLALKWFQSEIKINLKIYAKLNLFFPLRFHFYFLLRIWLWFAFIVLEALDVKIRGEKSYSLATDVNFHRSPGLTSSFAIETH